MKLNNPLDLLSLKVFGLGLEISHEKLAETRTFVLHVSLIVWSKEWSWQRKAS